MGAWGEKRGEVAEILLREAGIRKVSQTQLQVGTAG